MIIETKIQNGIGILSPRGNMVSGNDVSSLSRAVDELHHRGTAQFIFDLGGINMMDSSGLGELVSISNRGGKLKLVNVPNATLKLIEAANLTSLFKIFVDEREAIRSF